MFIDPHVHCRDGRQAYKETIAHALHVGENAGMTAIFDMPNTDPPVTTKELALERIALAKKADSKVFYGIHLALTADQEQIRNAVEAYKSTKEIVGLKLYAGHSVGNIGIIEENLQKDIYLALAQFGYDGVLAVHCEKEKYLKKDRWNPAEPWTHAEARPPESEVESVRDQISFALDAKFEGNLHIAHISVPEAVELVDAARKLTRITCGATPHHLLFDRRKMFAKNGLLYKMNPPLRPEGMPRQLCSYLKEGKIDWIETDHAPHTLEEKLSPPYMSGIPVLHFYPAFIEWIRTALGLTADEISNLTFHNIRRAYNLDIAPRAALYLTHLASEYPFDAFEEFSAKL